MDAPHATLQWDRGALEAPCDRAAVVRAGVEEYLGRRVFTEGGPLTVRVSLSRVASKAGVQVVARVSQEDASGLTWGERLVSGEGSDCSSLDEPLTLVVALLVDAPSRPDASPPAASPPNDPEPPPASPARERLAPDASEPIQTAPSLEQATAAPGHAAVVGHGVVSLGSLPTTAVGAGAFATVKPRGFWGVGAQAELLAPQRIRIGAGSLRTWLLVMGGSVCPLQGVDDNAWWSACAAFGVARLKVKSRGLIGSTSRTEWLALPGFSVRGGWRVRRGWLLVGGLEAAMPISPDRYVYRDPEGEPHVALEPSQLMITASVGVGWLSD